MLAFAGRLTCSSAGRFRGYPAAVPHSAQNFAVALKAALQFEHVLDIGLPHESQNLAPSRTGFWQLPHSTAAGAGGACCAGGGGGAGGA
jgi:hypothetical protein